MMKAWERSQTRLWSGTLQSNAWCTIEILFIFKHIIHYP